MPPPRRADLGPDPGLEEHREPAPHTHRKSKEKSRGAEAFSAFRHHPPQVRPRALLANRAIKLSSGQWGPGEISQRRKPARAFSTLESRASLRTFTCTCLLPQRPNLKGLWGGKCFFESFTSFRPNKKRNCTAVRRHSNSLLNLVHQWPPHLRHSGSLLPVSLVDVVRYLRMMVAHRYQMTSIAPEVF